MRKFDAFLEVCGVTTPRDLATMIGNVLLLVVGVVAILAIARGEQGCHE